ncbi:MAG TPA: hypothetical protein VF070_31995 [Streptosporangiaceae bacterium]
MTKPSGVHGLLAPHLSDPDRLRIIRARVYTHHSRIAARFAVGRVCPGILDSYDAERRTADGRAVRLDDVLGPWFAVLGYDTDPAGHVIREQRGFLAALGIRYVTTVASVSRHAGPGRRNPDTPVVEDAGGHLREWFARNRGCVAIIRPDRYIAALTDDSGFGTSVGRLRQLLGSGR